MHRDKRRDLDDLEVSLAEKGLACDGIWNRRPKTLVFGTRENYLNGVYQKPRSKPKTLLKVFDCLLTADIRCEAEILQHGLTAAVSCVCTSKKIDRDPECPVSSCCPIGFAGAANVCNPPFM